MHSPVRGTDLPSVMALAFLGDARHTLFVRRMLVAQGITKSGALNEQARRFVTAEAQAAMARRLEPCFSDEEREVYRRAFNSGHLNRPRHSSAADYRAATGLEAVIGMLDWLGDEERISELLALAHKETEDMTGEEK